jgi:hypothetical protein
MSDEKNKYNNLLYTIIIRFIKIRFINYATIANLSLLLEVLQVRQIPTYPGNTTSLIQDHKGTDSHSRSIMNHVIRNSHVFYRK